MLGTASQVPTRTRNHNGYLLLWDDEGFLFDPGEGTQRQLTQSRVMWVALTPARVNCRWVPSPGSKRKPSSSQSSR